jgi:hypothetical protein
MKSVEYRAYPTSCLAMVETVASEEARSSLILMAQCWHRLAREAETRNGRAPRGAPEEAGA